MPKHIHVSVAWPYANGDLHVGHLAGAYLPADIFARYHRLKGNHVLMVSGSDSHGTPISVEADKRGVPARQVFEHYHRRFLQTQQKIGISYDLFTHTDTENHHKIAQDFFLTLLERGHLYKQRQELMYSALEKRFLPDRYVEGECYICHFPDARGDQCDNCGSLLDATRLINPRNKSNPADQLVVRESEHYFLDLKRFEPELLAYLDRHKDRWRPNVVRFSRNFVADGLQGRPITRDIDWGIAVPLEGWDDKKLYVWFEAVMGYFTASLEWAKNTGQPDAWKDWWYNPQAEIYNFIGKDNIPFHTVIWQAELLGVNGIYNQVDDANRYDADLQLPYDVPANEFMNIEGRQFSKSRNWAIWLPDILERYQPDAVRYYVAATFPETADSDFAWDGFLSRVNNELLATWGNLANRMLSFAYKRFDGKVPAYDALTPEDEAIIAQSEAAFDQIGTLLEAVRLRDALQTGMALARDTNVYLDRRAPWKTIKDDPADAARAVYAVLRVVNNLKILLAPFLPFTSQKLHEYLGFDGQLFGSLNIVEYTEATRAHEALVYDGSRAIGRWEPGTLPPGQPLREPAPLIVKLDPEIVEQERALLGAPRDEQPITL
ncbi:MAG: methionine--tRNA ligase [Chloroflexi bacterium]|nr:methionine--tRNA ligase [Chloroflexota bacterium]MDL1884347.1 methionine--tRNA ligase [Anaerolineae bacterium CFX8]GIL14252.1 MAG: methionine--tRNA ligase [Chloroflexota bacterium]